MNEYRIRTSEYFNKKYNVTVEGIEAENMTIMSDNNGPTVLAFEDGNENLVAVFNSWDAAWEGGLLHTIRVESIPDDEAPAE